MPNNDEHSDVTLRTVKALLTHQVEQLEARLEHRQSMERVEAQRAVRLLGMHEQGKEDKP